MGMALMFYPENVKNNLLRNISHWGKLQVDPVHKGKRKKNKGKKIMPNPSSSFQTLEPPKDKWLHASVSKATSAPALISYSKS